MSRKKNFVGKCEKGAIRFSFPFMTFKKKREATIPLSLIYRRKKKGKKKRGERTVLYLHSAKGRSKGNNILIARINREGKKKRKKEESSHVAAAHHRGAEKRKKKGKGSFLRYRTGPLVGGGKKRKEDYCSLFSLNREGKRKGTDMRWYSERKGKKGPRRWIFPVVVGEREGRTACHRSRKKKKKGAVSGCHLFAAIRKKKGGKKVRSRLSEGRRKRPSSLQLREEGGKIRDFKARCREKKKKKRGESCRQRASKRTGRNDVWRAGVSRRGRGGGRGSRANGICRLSTFGEGKSGREEIYHYNGNLLARGGEKGGGGGIDYNTFSYRPVRPRKKKEKKEKRVFCNRSGGAEKEGKGARVSGLPPPAVYRKKKGKGMATVASAAIGKEGKKKGRGA